MTLPVTLWDGQPITAPGIYSGVPMAAYHSGKLCAGPSISSSGLRTIFDPARGPMAYWIEAPINPNRIEVDEEKEAFVLGRAAHHLMLGEAEFSRFYVARPSVLDGAVWQGNRTVCKEWLQHVRDQGLTVLTPGQIESIQGMAGILPWQDGLEDSGLKNSALVRAGGLSGLVEHTIVGRDEETGVYLLSRPDAIPLDSTEFNDFKTTQSVDDRSLRRTLEDYRYDMQAVLASICLEQAAGIPFSSFAFIFAMKKAPYAIEVAELSQIDLEEARHDLRAAIRTFARCLETGRWPGPAGLRGDARYLERSDFARKQAEARRYLLNNDLELTSV